MVGVLRPELVSFSELSEVYLRANAEALGLKEISRLLSLVAEQVSCSCVIPGLRLPRALRSALLRGAF